MQNIKVEKRATKYWVVVDDTVDYGEQRILYEGITKKSCLKYIGRKKAITNRNDFT